MNFFSKIVIFSLVALPLMAWSKGGKLDKIDEAGLKLLKSGKTFVWSKRQKNRTWPHMVFAKIVDMKPVEAMAFFSDFERHRTFIPGMIHSQIARKISNTHIIVKFVLKVPWPINKSAYTSGHFLEKIEGGGYRVRWYYVSGDDTSDVKGFAAFYPYEGKTLMRWENDITPKNKFFAGFFSKKVVNDTKTTVEKIVDAMQTYKRTEARSLSEKVVDLEKTLRK